MLKRLLALIILVPVGIAVVALAVANRQSVPVRLPLDIAGEPMVLFSAPFFLIAFALVLIGMVLGSMGTWFSQGKHRRRARENKVEATRMGFEAKKQKERAEALSEKKGAKDASGRHLALAGPKEA